MNLVVSLLLNYTVIGMLAFVASVLWALMDESDKTRLFVVFVTIVNLGYSWLLHQVLGRASHLVLWKYDEILLVLDQCLGVSAAAVARPLQGVALVPLYAAYNWIIPVTALWLWGMKNKDRQVVLLLAYVAELVAGLGLYAVVPVCGPIYALGAARLHPVIGEAHLVQLASVPNGFPSLHVATAVLLVMVSEGRWWRTAACVFLIATVLATLATGEHYILDLVPGFVFGCFAANVGFCRWRRAAMYFAVTLSWSIAVRFAFGWLMTHPEILRLAVVVTLIVAIHGIFLEWKGSEVQERTLTTVFAG
jgi:hypothetical protein